MPVPLQGSSQDVPYVHSRQQVYTFLKPITGLCEVSYAANAGFHEDVPLAIPSTTQVCLRFPQFVAGP